jgi:adenosylhomocysteine nucleosidase
VNRPTRRRRAVAATAAAFAIAALGCATAGGATAGGATAGGAAPPPPASAVGARVGLPPDTTVRLAILSAFDAELARLRDSARITGTRVINGRTHWVGDLAGRPVVLLLSGYSMVNAAMATQALLDHFRVSGIVFSGIAGGVNPSLSVGDVTVPAQWANYQEQVFARETADGWAPNGMAGELANFGMMYPRGESVIARADRPDSLVRRLWFPVDSTLLATARRVAGGVSLARCTPGGECLGRAPRIVVGGNGVSGPTFVDNAAYREYVWRTFGADALDMETAAVALVAHQNGVPYIAFRSLSDLAGGGSGGNEVRTFGRLAAENAAAVVLAYVRALPSRTAR